MLVTRYFYYFLFVLTLPEVLIVLELRRKHGVLV